MKYKKSVVASFAFLVIYICIYLAHIKWFKVDVVFYSAIFDGVFAVFLTLIIISLSSWFAYFDRFERTLLTIIWLLTSYGLAISVPTVIDRSLSFYILEKLEQRGGGIRLERFEEVFTEEYIHEHRLVDVRLTEQQESGTIKIENGCVILTDFGRKLTTFSRYFRQHMLPKERLLLGVYTDDLTDPFRASDNNYDYSCSQ